MPPAIPCSTGPTTPTRRGTSCALLAALLLVAPPPATAALVRLRWLQPAGSPEVLAFQIYKSLPSGAPSLVWEGLPARAADGTYEAQVDLPEIDTGSPIWVWLTAANSAGVSGRSNAVSYNVPGQPLGAPGKPVWDLE